MIVREPPDVRIDPDVALFLAGGITGCSNWQADVCAALADKPGVLFNPRRSNFPIGDPNAAPFQIRWEFIRLRLVDIILFWFAAETVQPIVLFEYGAALERSNACHQHLIVGCDKSYPRRQDVLIQTKLRAPGLIIHDQLDETIAYTAELIERLTDVVDPTQTAWDRRGIWESE